VNAVLDYAADHPLARNEQIASAVSVRLGEKVTALMVKKRLEQLRRRGRVEGRTVVQRELWPVYLLVDVPSPKLEQVAAAIRLHADSPELVEVKGVDVNCQLLVLTRVLDDMALDALRRHCTNAGAWQARALIAIATRRTHATQGA